MTRVGRPWCPILESCKRLEIVNNLVDTLQSAVKGSPVLDDDALAPPARQLLALVDPSQYGVGEATSPTRPSIPLTSSHLLINGPRDHAVSSEIKRELASADRVDLLVSFLKWSGWRLLRDEARRFLDRHPGGTCRQIMPTPRILAMEAPHARIRPDHV